jgi:hypothetical protein
MIKIQTFHLHLQNHATYSIQTSDQNRMNKVDTEHPLQKTNQVVSNVPILLEL